MTSVGSRQRPSSGSKRFRGSGGVYGKARFVLLRTLAFVPALLLAACGGSEKPAASVDVDTFTVSALAGQQAPQPSFVLTLADPSLTATFTAMPEALVGYADREVLSPTQIRFTLRYFPPSYLADGTYAGDMYVNICVAPDCLKEAPGSPIRLRSRYQVGTDPTMRASLSGTSFSLTRDTYRVTQQSAPVVISITPAPENGFYAIATTTHNGISTAQAIGSSTSFPGSLQLNFRPLQEVGFGVFNDTVNVRVCYESTCRRELPGSPFTVTTRYETTLPVDPVATPLPLASRMALAHNIVDAEYSRTLNQVVMLATYPANAVYSYDVATGVERSRPLDRAPRALALSPDGRTAAIGHDYLLNLVDVATIGQAGAPAISSFNVSADVSDLVLDGHGHVHWFPRTDQWVYIRSIDVATGTEALSFRLVRQKERGLLHPSGDVIYSASNDGTPDDITRWDISSGVAVRQYDSRYHGNYSMCGRIWFDGPGTRIYTACGHVFSASAQEADDIFHLGKLDSSDYEYSWLIAAADHSSVRGELAAIEVDGQNCPADPRVRACFNHLRLFDGQTFATRAVYSLGRMTLGGKAYEHRGLFVFYTADGARKILLGKLEGMADPAAEHYLSVLQ
jgi:hypothetical protein